MEIPIWFIIMTAVFYCVVGAAGLCLINQQMNIAREYWKDYNKLMVAYFDLKREECQKCGHRKVDDEKKESEDEILLDRF